MKNKTKYTIALYFALILTLTGCDGCKITYGDLTYQCSKCSCRSFIDNDNNDRCESVIGVGPGGTYYCTHSKGEHTRH